MESLIKKLGRYEVVETIASGGMATVYLARQSFGQDFEKIVALKVLHEHLAEEREFVTMFIDEARLSASLVHGNIVPVFDFGIEDGRYFMAMEYIAGTSLSRFNKTWKKRTGTPLPPPLVTYVISETLAGLAYAHAKAGDDGQPLGIIHRDVSPQNILLSNSGEVKIADFGIAHARERLTVSEAGVVKGKKRYMAPEQASAQPLDHRVDIYATAVMTYELLTDESPFKAISSVKTAKRPAKPRFEPSQESLSLLPKKVVQVLKTGLAYEPQKRFVDADAFAQALTGAVPTEWQNFRSRNLAQIIESLNAPPGAETANLFDLFSGRSQLKSRVSVLTPDPQEQSQAKSQLAPEGSRTKHSKKVKKKVTNTVSKSEILNAPFTTDGATEARWVALVLMGLLLIALVATIFFVAPRHIGEDVQEHGSPMESAR